jgi:hypothetical protein
MNQRVHLACWAVVFGLIASTCQAIASDKEERSRFAGTYSGKFISHTSGNAEPTEGVVTASVDEMGNIKGEATNTSQNQTAKLEGAIDQDGKVKLTFEFPDATYTAVGTASKTTKRNIIGTLIQKSGMRAFGGIEFELVPKS